MLSWLSRAFRNGGIYGTTDPDLNIDISVHGELEYDDRRLVESMLTTTRSSKICNCVVLLSLVLMGTLVVGTDGYSCRWY